MFETALLESTIGDPNPLTGRHRIGALFAGVIFEFTALGALLLVPLIRTQALDLRNLPDRVGPPPPPRAVKIIAVVRERADKPAPSQWYDGRIIAPRNIPEEVARIVDEPAPQLDSDLGAIGGDPTGRGVPGSVMLDILVGAMPIPLPPSPSEHPAKGVRRISKGGEVQAAKLIFAPKPDYPPLARSIRVQGPVQLEAIIAVDGRVQNLRVVSGHPLLIQAAIDAVSQWRYQPTLLNGEPVEVQTEVNVNFILAQ